MSIYLYIITFILGACIASFLNVIAYDLPIGANWLTRSSACPHCHTAIPPTQLIPICSYLCQKGRCHNCDTKISPLYLLTELLGGFLFTLPLLLPNDFSLLQLVHTWIFSSLLIIITLTDIYHGLIPNKILVTFGIVFLLMKPHIFSAVVGFSLFFIAAWFGKQLFKKETLGAGDIKCYFVIGLAVPLNVLLLSIILSCFLALLYLLLIVKDKHAPIPFAPFIALGVMVIMMISSI